MDAFKRILKVAVCLMIGVSGPVIAGNGNGDLSDHEGPVDVGSFGGIYGLHNGDMHQMQFGISDDLGNSFTVLIDKATDRVYLSDSLGKVSDISIASLGGAFAPGSTGTAFANELRTSLDNDLNYEMVGRSFASDFGILPPQDFQCHVIWLPVPHGCRILVISEANIPIDLSMLIFLKHGRIFGPQNKSQLIDNSSTAGKLISAKVSKRPMKMLLWRVSLLSQHA